MKSFEKYWNAQKNVAAFHQKPPSPDVVGFIQAHFPAPESVAALDLGCGGGRHTRWMASYGFKTKACDLHKEMAAITQKSVSDAALSVEVKVASATQLPYEDATFDFVLSTGVLHNFSNLRDLRKALQEVARICKQDGLFFLTIFTNDLISTELKHVAGDLYSTADDIPMLLVSPDTVDDLCRTAGLNKFTLVRQYVTKVETGERSVYSCVYRRA